jgi:hypothetical protein
MNTDGHGFLTLLKTWLVNWWEKGYQMHMVELEDIVGGEWADWYRLTPLERWEESGELWAHYLQIGGSLDPEPDTQSPFYDGSAPSPSPADGRPGVRVVRRSRV